MLYLNFMIYNKRKKQKTPLRKLSIFKCLQNEQLDVFMGLNNSLSGEGVAF